MALSVVYTTINGRLIQQVKGGQVTKFVSDTLGSVVAEVDDTGQVTHTADYWPYGEVRTETGTKKSPFGYVGVLGYMKDFADALYVRARYLRTKLCSWLTHVSVRNSALGEQQYGYALQNPTSYVDYTGRSPLLYYLLRRFKDSIVPTGDYVDVPIVQVGDWSAPVGMRFEKCLVGGLTIIIPKPKIYPFYGRYCGPQTVSGEDIIYPFDGLLGITKGAPVSAVDGCCRDHDNAWGEIGCNAWNQFFRAECRDITRKMCECLKRANCKGNFSCEVARFLAKKYACNKLFTFP